MWALVDTDNKVLTVYPPDFDQDKMVEEADGRRLILMTLENSPGWVGGTYVDGKFYPPEELKERING